MAVSDAARADLYTGLVETLGESRANTLMSLSHEHDHSQLVTKTDLQLFKVELKSELGAELGAQIRALGDSLNARIDRLFHLVVVVMLAVLAAMTSLYFT